MENQQNESATVGITKLVLVFCATVGAFFLVQAGTGSNALAGIAATIAVLTSAWFIK
jgi:hypothetical protein